MPKNKTVVRPGQKPVSIRARREQRNNPNNSNPQGINISNTDLDKISRYTKKKGQINDEILTLLPELKQAKDIVVASTISPNDFSAKEILSGVNDSMGLSDTMTTSLRSIIDKAAVKFKIEGSLNEMVTEPLFGSGAYVELIMPRAKVEDIIMSNTAVSKLNSKVDLESFKASDMELSDIVGHISIDLESANIDFGSMGVSAISNPYSLSLPSVYERKLETATSRSLYASPVLDAESAKADDSDIAVLNKYSLMKKLKTKATIAIDNNTDDINLDDVPFRMRLESSSVAPIYTDKSKHLGYLVLTDEMYRTISKTPSDTDVTRAMRSNDKVVQDIISKNVEAMGVSGDKSPELSNMIDVVGDVLLSTIENSMDKSIYKNNYNVELENDLVKIMLYRSLKSQKTKIVYVPAEYIHYGAFQYRKNGTGKSLLEDVALLASFKAMLLVSEVYSGVLSSIPITDYIINIDDDDPEPDQTRAEIKTALDASNNSNMLWGSTKMEEYGPWIQGAGNRYVWKNKKFANTTIEIDRHNNTNNYQVDDTTSNKVGDYIIKHIGLSPSLINDSVEVEFASVATINNSLTRKVMAERQDVLNDNMTDLLIKLVKSDSAITKDIYDLVESNKKEFINFINDANDGDDKIKELSPIVLAEITRDVIEMIAIRVPKAESDDSNLIRERFDDYLDSVDSMLTVLKESTSLAEIAREVGIDEDIALGNLRLGLMMTWCDENNYMRPIVTLLDSKNSKKELQDLINRIASKDASLIELTTKIAKSLNKNKEKALKKVEATEPEPIVTESTPPDDGTEPEALGGEADSSIGEEEEELTGGLGDE